MGPKETTGGQDACHKKPCLGHMMSEGTGALTISLKNVFSHKSHKVETLDSFTNSIKYVY